MCYRTKLNSRIKEIEKTFNAPFIEPEAYTPQEEINAFDFSTTPVITDVNPGEIELFHWGLIPHWAKDDKIRKMTLNAKIETAEKKPAFRNAVTNRCLIIADGYYEWQWLDPKGKSKQKHLLEVQDQEIFTFAGIYSSWRNPDTDELINSYSILTTEANELMSEIHNNKKRMPVILHKQDQAKWISGTEISRFSFPYEVPLKATKI
ncbi:Putative SOS response-associated peptidase YedK [Salinimicrobium catena]|uniref:Abasic site processing protein n=1 Tax=Salinimicrobium catena TaxID=390640 RepID=A0A1H5P524_9FLAO|nr:SOS response-associated peptidase [Salinimicrobium catena]SDL71834.1 Putative SOS response-associated peptidase YedK [Salinimicrobium catena]SEF09092.1 Putative SOS response-associated peptidase YedK [Salinimicrobium catena]